MKRHTEKQPIDDLFARKIGNMSLPPSADGFERLQARMGQQKPEVRLIFWHNPTVQQYMAAAACLLLVCLFGWLYWPSGGAVEQSQMATNQQEVAHPKKSVQPQIKQRQNETKPNVETPNSLDQDIYSEQIAVSAKSVEKDKRNNGSASRSTESDKAINKTVPTETNKPVLAQTKPIETPTTADTPALNTLQGVSRATVEQLAENKAITKSIPVAERVLVVTIAEPESLIAARQTAKASVEDKAVVTQNEKSEKETKVSGLWQQVKRIKQGDVFARQDDMSNDDRGLLGRAYNGLKHSFDKDKSAKQ